MSNSKMLVPDSHCGTKNQIIIEPGYEWITQLPDKKIYFALFQTWNTTDLPIGYDYYIVSFHLEAVNLSWLKKQKVTGPIIVLFDGYHYNYKIPNVYFFTFFYWHYQLKKMQDWFGIKQKLKPQYKFSAVCNRVTQSKVWVTTKLLETAHDSSLIVLNSWIEERNVHNWQKTNNTVLDKLTDIFQTKYQGTEIKIDNFDNAQHNLQKITGNPWQPLYQESAIHFTNESFHYSSMFEDNQRYICPGPFLTEKTLKCLLGQTAFIPVGQYQTYHILKNLGLTFDYGFDTSWDLDSGNLTRFESIINLIDYLNQIDINDLVAMTTNTSEYNQNQILSGKFFDRCQKENNESIEKIVNLIS